MWIMNAVKWAVLCWAAVFLVPYASIHEWATRPNSREIQMTQLGNENQRLRSELASLRSAVADVREEMRVLRKEILLKGAPMK